MKKPHGQHTSQILASISKQVEEKKSISLEEILNALDNRAFGMLIVLFCIPNCLPVPNPPGLSALTGIPIILLGLQIVAGKHYPWLPKAWAQKPFSTAQLARILVTALPYVQKVEKFLHPRLEVMATAPMHRLLGVVFVVLAVLMSLPIPFGNFLPGIAMALIAIGLMECDGLMIILGLLVGSAAIVLMLTITNSIISVMNSLWE